ncbi:MAG: hypothetical protein H9W81_12590 [Enterococcus sp.]|nr:hypothetical protein [Enterococcus sp.]
MINAAESSSFEAGFDTRKEAEDLVALMTASRNKLLQNNKPSSFAETLYPNFHIVEVPAIEDNPVYHTYYSAKLEIRSGSMMRKYTATVRCHTMRESKMLENPSLYIGFQHLLEHPDHPVLLGKTESSGGITVEEYITFEPMNLPFVEEPHVIYLD